MTLERLRATDSRPAWTTEDSARLNEGLTLQALTATDLQMAQLQAYGQLLLKWNRTYNLLGATSAAALVQDHLLDSLATLPAMKRWMPTQTGTLVDIGSGAGLPGLVLAIMLKPLQVRLVEPNGKKAAFLRQAIAQCDLSTVEVAECRIEDLNPAPGRSSGNSREPQPLRHPTHFICRAFASLARYTTLCRPKLQEGSLLFAMKAARVGEEVSQLDRWVEVLAVEPLLAAGKDVAGNDVQRNLVVMRSSDPLPLRALNTARPLDGSASGGLLGNHTDDR